MGGDLRRRSGKGQIQIASSSASPRRSWLPVSISEPWTVAIRPGRSRPSSEPGPARCEPNRLSASASRRSQLLHPGPRTLPPGGLMSPHNSWPQADAIRATGPARRVDEPERPACFEGMKTALKTPLPRFWVRPHRPALSPKPYIGWSAI